MLIAILSAVAMLGAPPAKVCHDANAKAVACPQSAPAAQHCHDVKGKDIRCGLPGARPTGVKTQKPRS